MENTVLTTLKICTDGAALASLGNCSKRHAGIMELCSFYVYESFQCNQYTLHHISYIDNFIISSITSVAFSDLTASLERCSIIIRKL